MYREVISACAEELLADNTICSISRGLHEWAGYPGRLQSPLSPSPLVGEGCGEGGFCGVFTLTPASSAGQALTLSHQGRGDFAIVLAGYRHRQAVASRPVFEAGICAEFTAGLAPGIPCERARIETERKQQTASAQAAAQEYP